VELQVRIKLNLRAEFCHHWAEVTASKAGCGGHGLCCEQWHFLDSALVELQTHFVVKILCISSCLPIFKARSPVLSERVQDESPQRTLEERSSISAFLVSPSSAACPSPW